MLKSLFISCIFFLLFLTLGAKDVYAQCQPLYRCTTHTANDCLSRNGIVQTCSAGGILGACCLPILCGVYCSQSTCGDPLCAACVFCLPAPGTVGGAGLNWARFIFIGTPNFISSSVGGIVYALLRYIFGIAGFLILLYIVWGGYQILTSQGDPKGIASGREKITYAIIGFIVVFVAFWIVQLVARILNLQPIISIFG